MCCLTNKKYGIIKCYKLILSYGKYDYYIRQFQSDRNKELLKELNKIDENQKIDKLYNSIKSKVDNRIDKTKTI